MLKETLLRHGFAFESETDTEVIPKLAKFIFDNMNEEGIVLDAVSHLCNLLFATSTFITTNLCCLSFILHGFPGLIKTISGY